MSNRAAVILGTLALAAAFVVGCIVAPGGLTRQELIQENQALSIENLRLRAELDTANEVCK